MPEKTVSKNPWYLKDWRDDHKPGGELYVLELSELAALLRLRAHSDDEGFVRHPVTGNGYKDKDLVIITGLSHNTMKRAIFSLAECGLLEVNKDRTIKLTHLVYDQDKRDKSANKRYWAKQKSEQKEATQRETENHQNIRLTALEQAKKVSLQTGGQNET